MKKKILTLAMLAGLSAGAFAQDPRKSDIKITADIAAGCDLTAENINFGVLMMPLSDSSTQSHLKVKCSKNTSLEFSVFYSENANGSSDVYTFVSKGDGLNHQNGSILKNGKNIDNYNITTALYCSQNPSNGYYGVYTGSLEFSKLTGVPFGVWVKDTYNLCSSDGKRVNLNTIASLGSNKGLLKGVSASEAITYYLSVPDKSDTVWSNLNKYSIVSNGEQQLVSMKAHIKRADNPTYRMTPDTYQSTLTVLLTY